MPSNGSTASAVPWKAITGTGLTAGQGLGNRRPATGATAAKVCDASQASWLAIRPPPDMPVAYTRLVLTQYRASRLRTRPVRNVTSLAAFAGGFWPPSSGTPGMFQS